MKIEGGYLRGEAVLRGNVCDKWVDDPITCFSGAMHQERWTTGSGPALNVEAGMFFTTSPDGNEQKGNEQPKRRHRWDGASEDVCRGRLSYHTLRCSTGRQDVLHVDPDLHY
jgi:hypothetical protein